MLKRIFFLGVLLVLASCARDADDYQLLTADQLDSEIAALIDIASSGEGNSFFILSGSDDYSAIPQKESDATSRTRLRMASVCSEVPEESIWSMKSLRKL